MQLYICRKKKKKNYVIDLTKIWGLIKFNNAAIRLWAVVLFFYKCLCLCYAISKWNHFTVVEPSECPISKQPIHKPKVLLLLLMLLDVMDVCGKNLCVYYNGQTEDLSYFWRIHKAKAKTTEKSVRFEITTPQTLILGSPLLRFLPLSHKIHTEHIEYNLFEK